MAHWISSSNPIDGIPVGCMRLILVSDSQIGHDHTHSILWDLSKELRGSDDINKIRHSSSTFAFIHLADPFIQSDLQLLYLSEVARLWSN